MSREQRMAGREAASAGRGHGSGRGRPGGRRARVGVVGAAVATVAVAGSILVTSVVGDDRAAEAQTFRADTLTASDDVRPGDALCADAAGGCSLRAAIQETEALTGQHTITLGFGEHDLGGPITVRSKLQISRDWSGGPSQANPVIDLDDQPGFRVEGGGLTLSGIDVINGLDVDGAGGAAIHGAGAEIIVSDGAFRNNRTDGFGGAIFVATGALRVYGDFEDNAALGGGAVAVIGAELTGAATFTRNGASGSGGAIHALQPRRLAMDGATFTENVALDQGGALFIEGHGGTSTFEVLRSAFTGNSSGNEGGALFVGMPSSPAQFRVWRGTFSQNIGLVGGAIASDWANVLVDQSTFDENQAVGGAGGAVGAGGTLAVTSSDFTGNEADGNGGAIGSNAGLTVSGSDFEGNRATGFGGAIATFSQSTPSITGGSMTGNEGVEGAGAIWRIGSDPDLDGVSITGNLPAGDEVFVADPLGEGDGEPPDTTVPPTTVPPTTVPPTTTPPSTVPPSTVPPSTVPPSTVPPSTVPPSTVAPGTTVRPPASTSPPTTSPRTTVGTTTPTVPASTNPPSTAPAGVDLPPVPAVPPGYTAIAGLPATVLRGQTLDVPLPAGTVSYQVVLYSEPVVLATGGAASSVTVTLPSNVALGSHTLVVWAIVGDGVSVTGHAFQAVELPPSGFLPTTGSSPMQVVATATLLIAAGAVIILLARRRHPV